MQTEQNRFRSPKQDSFTITSAGLDIRSARREDEPELTALHRDVAGLDRGSDYWQWKYRDNPAGESIVCVAVDGSRIVGEAAAVPVRVKIGSAAVLACRACDIVVTGGYRRTLPLSRMFETVLDEYRRKNWAFAFGIPDTRTRRMGTRLPGFVRVRACRTLVKILNPSPFLRRGMGNRLLSRTLGAVGARGFRMVNSLKLQKIKGVEISEEDRFDERFDKLWQQWSRDVPLTVIRDTTYLNWRYCDDPLYRYRIYSANCNGECKGFIVLLVKDTAEIRVGFIMDLMALDQDHRILDSLLRTAIDHCYDEGVDCLNVWDPGFPPLSHFLVRRGYVARETPQLLVVRPGERLRKESLFIEDDWFLALGDNDHI